ncbi:MAG TPA: hypothetical protein PK442_11650, partial [Synergistales bacterium]|nr:hypothetical protein [Synergistales bacterium]
MKKCLMLVLIFIYSFFFKVDGTAAWTDVYFNAEVSLSHYVNEDAHFLGIWNADKYRTGCDDFDNAPMKLSQDVALILVAYLIASETNETYGSVYQGMADTRLDVYRKNVKNPFEKSAITNAHNKLVEYYRNALKSGKKINLPEYYYIKRVDSNFFDVNDDRNVYYFDAFNLHMSKFAVRSLRIHMSDDSGVRKRIPWRITS